MFNEEGNHIDELFRSVLKDHQETPPESAWDNIVEKRSFGHILMNQISLNWKNFMFLTFIFATAGISIIMATDGSKKQSATQDKNHQVQSNQIESKSSSNLQLAYNEPSGGVIHGMRQAGSPTHGPNNHTTESIIHSNNTIIATTKKHNSLNNKTTSFEIEPKKEKVEDSKLVDQKITKSNRKRKEKIASLKVSQLINASTNSLLNKNTSTSILNNNSASNVLFEEFNVANNHIDFLNSKGISSLTSLEDRFLLLDSNYYKPETRKKLTFKNHLFVSIKAGPEFHQSNYSVKNGEFNDYRDNRKSGTASKVGGSLHLTLSYYFHNNILIETGFRYNQLREEVKYESYRIISEQTVYDSTLLGYKVGPTGEPEAIYDITERTIVEKDITSNRNINVYHSLGVPLLVGYQIDFNRFSFQLKTGASLTFLSKRTGEIVGIDENQTIELGANDDPYKNSLLWNWEIAAGFGYQLTENVNLILEPTYRNSINNVTLDDAPISEKNKTLGILTGIRIKL
jgi:hypothetical protein